MLMCVIKGIYNTCFCILMAAYLLIQALQDTHMKIVNLLWDLEMKVGETYSHIVI